MSKNILWIIALAFFSSCQDKTTSEPVANTASEPAAEVQAAKKIAADKVEDKILATEVVESTSKPSASETQIKVQINKCVEVSKADQPEVKVVSKSDAPKQETQVKGVVDKTPAVKAAVEKVAPKVVAPLIQGKGPIKSEPNPAPSDKMIKSGVVMNAAKANSLTKKCKACHATDKDKVGPSWKKIQAVYGSVDTLAVAFESGFAVESRKVAMSDAKWKKKAKTMTGQYKTLIKKQVSKGKFTYKELAEAIFAK